MPGQEASMRRVTAIRNGTVIDHVPAGKALSVLKMLGINGQMSNPVSLVMNVPSQKMGGKDIIKVEDRELTQTELDRLALVAPDASVAIIRAYSVAEKMEINLTDEVVNVARCTFSNCITTNMREPLPHRLVVVKRDPLELRCRYCGKTQDVEDLIDNIL
ncbi:MAG: aspartate carbamoyltransferase regulatory subunit [Candidatus Poseidoniales archaeon]